MCGLFAPIHAASSDELDDWFLANRWNGDCQHLATLRLAMPAARLATAGRLPLLHLLSLLRVPLRQLLRLLLVLLFHLLHPLRGSILFSQLLMFVLLFLL